MTLARIRSNYRFEAVIIPHFLVRAVLVLMSVVTSLAAGHEHGPTGTYTEWNWPDPPPNANGKSGYESFEHGLRVDIEPDANVGFFWAHQGSFVDGDTFYLGLQTLGRHPDGAEGKVAIFSVWNAREGSSSGIAQPFSGEGEGFQTLIPYDWRANRKYRLRISRSGQNRKGTEWTSTVRDESSGEEVEIGTITVPKSWGYLGPWSVMWSERYTGPDVRDCHDVGRSKVLFEAPRANDGATKATSHRNYLAEPANCPNSRVGDTRNGVWQEMGAPDG